MSASAWWAQASAARSHATSAARSSSSRRAWTNSWPVPVEPMRSWTSAIRTQPV